MSIDLNEPEVQEAIKAAVTEAVKGLKGKNDELISELRKARKDSTIDPDDYNRAKDEVTQLTEKLSEAQKIIKASSLDIEKYKKAHESESSFSSKLIMDNSVNEALLKIGVLPELTKAAKALFISQAQIKVDGDTRTAVIGDKSISDYAAEWGASDEGKHFTAAQLNHGGGGQGGSSQGGTQKTLTREQFDSKTPGEKMDFAKSGGKIV